MLCSDKRHLMAKRLVTLKLRHHEQSRRNGAYLVVTKAQHLWLVTIKHRDRGI